MTYLNQFLNLNCAGDIINIIPKQKKYEKEISESMAIIDQLRSIILKEPNKYTIIDMCAGNALTSVLSAFIFPIKKSIAIDLKKRNGKYDKVNKFEYIEDNINSNNIKQLLTNTDNIILIAIHPCKNSAIDVIEIYNIYNNIKYLFLIPCCVGNLCNYDNFIHKKLGRYIAWTYKLKDQIESKNIIYQNNKILSPCNIILKGYK